MKCDDGCPNVEACVSCIVRATATGFGRSAATNAVSPLPPQYQMSKYIDNSHKILWQNMSLNHTYLEKIRADQAIVTTSVSLMM